MLQFSKKTEYALLAMGHMIQKTQKNQPVTSAREISDSYLIPYALLAKILQQLSNKGLIKSMQGINGGYILVKKPEDISVMSLVEVFEGRFAVAECFREEKITCPQWDGCSIRSPLYELNHKIYQMLAETSVLDVTAPKPIKESKVPA